MKNTKQFYILALLLIAFVCSSLTVAAQTKKRKNHRRKTVVGQSTPSVPPPVVNNNRVLQPEVISRAEDSQTDDNAAIENNQQSASAGVVGTDANKALATDKSNLTQQVDRLNNKMNSLEGEQRSLLNLEKLTRAEERAELLRKQLNEAVDKETAVKAKIEQLDYSLRPEIIERDLAGVGSTRPEEARDTRRKMLENEKTRSKEQLIQIAATRARLETALTNADSLVDKLNSVVNNDNKSDKAKENQIISDTNKDNSSRAQEDNQLPPQ